MPVGRKRKSNASNGDGQQGGDDSTEEELEEDDDYAWFICLLCNQAFQKECHVRVHRKRSHPSSGRKRMLCLGLEDLLPTICLQRLQWSRPSSVSVPGADTFSSPSQPEPFELVRRVSTDEHHLHECQVMLLKRGDDNPIVNSAHLPHDSSDSSQSQNQTCSSSAWKEKALIISQKSMMPTVQVERLRFVPSEPNQQHQITDSQTDKMPNDSNSHESHDDADFYESEATEAFSQNEVDFTDNDDTIDVVNEFFGDRDEVEIKKNHSAQLITVTTIRGADADEAEIIKDEYEDLGVNCLNSENADCFLEPPAIASLNLQNCGSEELGQNENLWPSTIMYHNNQVDENSSHASDANQQSDQADQHVESSDVIDVEFEDPDRKPTCSSSTDFTDLRSILYQSIQINVLDIDNQIMYNCSICALKDKQLMTLKEHIRGIHRNGESCSEKLYSCEVCGKIFIGPNKIMVHRREHSKPTRHRGEFVQKGTDKNGLTQCLRCHRCDKLFNRRCDYTRHLNSGHPQTQEHKSTISCISNVDSIRSPPIQANSNNQAQSSNGEEQVNVNTIAQRLRPGPRNKNKPRLIEEFSDSDGEESNSSTSPTSSKRNNRMRKLKLNQLEKDFPDLSDLEDAVQRKRESRKTVRERTWTARDCPLCPCKFYLSHFWKLHMKFIHPQAEISSFTSTCPVSRAIGKESSNNDESTTTTDKDDKAWFIHRHERLTSCPMCCKPFPTLKDMNKHILYHHLQHIQNQNSNMVCDCSFCVQHFDISSSSSNDEEKKYQCKLCPKQMSTECKIRFHIFQAHVLGTGFNAKQADILKKDRAKKMVKKEFYKCLYCPCKYIKECHLDFHLFRCHEHEFELEASEGQEVEAEAAAEEEGEANGVQNPANSDNDRSDNQNVQTPIRESRTPEAVEPVSVGDGGASDVSNSKGPNSSKHDREDSAAGVNVKQPFACEVCGLTFAKLYQMNKHVQRMHLAIKPEKCDICGKRFAFKSGLDEHIMGVHQGKSKDNLCNICGVVLATSYTLQMHLVQAHGDKWDYSCDICGKPFKLFTKLSTHRKTHNKVENPSLCSICGKELKTKFRLNNHLKIVHSEHKPHECPEPGCSFTCKLKYNLKTHLATHSDARPYKCSQCNKTFKCLQNKSQHELTHKELKYTCKICDKTYDHISTLRRHNLDVHVREEDKKHECQECGKKFLKSTQLTLHEATHRKRNTTGKQLQKKKKTRLKKISSSETQIHQIPDCASIEILETADKA